MKIIFISLVSILLPVLNSIAEGVIVIEGKYQNKNIYVQNGFASSGAGFCVYEVTINGLVTTDELNSSSFEIDFTQQQIAVGASVIVQIKHKDDCFPKILNPDVLKPAPTFETLSIKVNEKGIINWTTKGESASLPYIIEQFKWNKWVVAGEVQGTGSRDKNDYSFLVALTSGENKFRVKQVGISKKPKYSNETRIVIKIPQVKFEYFKPKQQIAFNSETHYEVYDRYGNIIKKGFGKSIEVSNLENSVYYLSYDNITSEFHKK